MCNLCDQFDETTDHLVSRTGIAKEEYIKRPNKLKLQNAFTGYSASILTSKLLRNSMNSHGEHNRPPYNKVMSRNKPDVDRHKEKRYLAT